MASYRKLDTGWEFRIIYKDHNGKRREKSKRGFKTKKLAQIAAAEEELLFDLKTESLRNMTIYDYSVRWANIYKRPHITAKTWKTYTKNFKHIKTYFGDSKIKDISPSSYQQILNNFGQKVAQSTLEKLHYHIKGAMKAAVRDGIIRDNFAEGAIIKAQKAGQSKEDKFLQEDEYLNFIKIAKSKIQYPSYLTAYLIAVTGLRFAEVQGLTWDDIDFEKGTIDINKTYDYSISQEFGPTKNKQSMRMVPVDGNTLQALQYYKDNYYKDNQLDRICFGTSNNAANKAIKKATGKNATCHSLRHTYASYLIFKGVDLISISQLLGHENLTITLKVYAHQLEKLKDKNNAEIKEIFSKITFGG
ncbi:site-specific integrase [Streptococcus caviae]|uniref:site-specific integrase n=1 Tax=Streptococcus sp. 'caviae' TaxID=1915004 RepID=UPI00094BBDD3|nr:tyrosine-type recombinase/integrase [Streptococcus sp. 'caviae']OLN84579.1 site-specific integrase [Streptococcus sp. 'caviae']